MKQYLEDAMTPSNMPIRQQFGNWTGFMQAMGLEPNKPMFSKLARENSVKSRKGKRSAAWKGGRYTNRGYVMVWQPELKTYRGEHRIVMEKHLGRPLKNIENVHHINGKRDDNRIENLELWASIQPAGQRVKDLVKFAKEILDAYPEV